MVRTTDHGQDKITTRNYSYPPQQQPFSTVKVLVGSQKVRATHFCQFDLPPTIIFITVTLPLRAPYYWSDILHPENHNKRDESFSNRSHQQGKAQASKSRQLAAASAVGA
jgi:hypothetical protein